MPEFIVKSSVQQQVLDITSQVVRAVEDAGLNDGLCTVFVPHATAAVIINENADPHIADDLLEALDTLIPQGRWRHDRIDNNGAAHIKAAMLGPSESIPISQGRLVLGTWQAIMLVDLDGPRARRVVVCCR